MRCPRELVGAGYDDVSVLGEGGLGIALAVVKDADGSSKICSTSTSSSSNGGPDEIDACVRQFSCARPCYSVVVSASVQ